MSCEQMPQTLDISHAYHVLVLVFEIGLNLGTYWGNLRDADLHTNRYYCSDSPLVRPLADNGLEGLFECGIGESVRVIGPTNGVCVFL